MREQDRSGIIVNRRRYVTLDGLRGVAAVMVVFFHTGSEVGIGAWRPRFGYLAVDLFFLLSGFVLAQCYEPRLRRGMTAREFLLLRVMRLYPLYVLGLLLGAVLALFGLGLSGLTIKRTVISFCLGLFGLPAYVFPHGQVLFSLNIPFWSLFFEFWVANLFFALCWRHLTWKGLLSLILLCGIGLIISEKVFYTMNVGPSWRDLGGGFARVGFSFFLGVAVAHIHRARPPRLKLPSWFFILLLPIALSLPLGVEIGHRYELACVFVLFPAIVYWGAEALERRPLLGTTLGDASYALYTIHFPLMLLVSHGLMYFSLNRSLLIQVLFVAVSVPLAWALSIADVRIRAALSVRTKGRRISQRDVAFSESQ